MRRPLAGGLCLLLANTSALAADSSEKCESCRIVADAFLRRLSQENPVRNHLDMRHRLDKDGKRYGKVIDYRVSELRATELLDDLCEDMQQYTWAPEALPGADAAGAGAADDTPPEPSGKPPSMAEVTDKVLAGTQLRWRWQRTSEVDGTAPPSMRAPKAEQKQRRKELQAFCYSLLERTEEKLTAYLSEDKPHHEGVDDFICAQLMPYCPLEAQTAPRGAAGVDAAKDEL